MVTLYKALLHSAVCLVCVCVCGWVGGWVGVWGRVTLGHLAL